MIISRKAIAYILLGSLFNWSTSFAMDDDMKAKGRSGAKGTLSLISDDQKMYHIGLSKNDIEGAKYVILPGDPGRVKKIAEFLENSKPVGQNREYTSYLGDCNGEKVLVMSTGMGGPSTSIGVEELSMLGVKNFIRVGTSGGMQLDVNAGDLVVSTGAVRQEGTSKEYAPIEFPAVPDFTLTRTLCDAAESISNSYNLINKKESKDTSCDPAKSDDNSSKPVSKKIKVHIGTVHCKDSFYGQHNPDRMPVSSELKEKWKAWIDLGVKCSEMETASLFVLGNYLKVRTAAILLVVWNQEQEKLGISQDTNFDTDLAIKAVVNAISDSIQKDKNKS